MRRAAGLPLPPRDVAALGELDLFGARALAAFIEGGLPVDGLIEASRVFGEAAAHAAAAAGTLANVAIPQEGDNEYEYARRLGAATRELTPYAAELLGVMYMLHNRENIRQEIVAADEIVAGRRSDVHEVTIGFCDVVGFTRLGEGVPGGRPGRDRHPARGARGRRRRAARAADQDDRRRGHVRRARAGAAARHGARA